MMFDMLSASFVCIVIRRYQIITTVYEGNIEYHDENTAHKE